MVSMFLFLFFKVDFENNSANDNKSMKKYPARKDLMYIHVVSSSLHSQSQVYFTLNQYPKQIRYLHFALNLLLD